MRRTCSRDAQWRVHRKGRIAILSLQPSGRGKKRELFCLRGRLHIRGCTSTKREQCAADIASTRAGPTSFNTSGCRTFKKDNLAKHVQTSDHRASLSAISGRRDMERAIANAHRSEEQAVIATFKTVYFMAKKNLASDIFSDLKEFLIVQVCPLYVVSDSLLTKMVIEALLQRVLLTLQGNTAIGDLTFRSNRGVRTFTYEHSESVRGFQVNH